MEVKIFDTHVRTRDGRYLLSASYDGTARVWPMDPRNMIQRACATAGRNLLEEEWTQYVGAREYQKICG